MFRSLGEFIRLRRQERNLSQERLAEMAEISRPQIAAMERGENFSLQYLVKVANALELTELPIDGLHLREAPPDLGLVVRAADLVNTARRLVAQIGGTLGDFDGVSTDLDGLIDRSLSPAGSTQAITDGAERMRRRPAGEHGRIAAGLHELGSRGATRSEASTTTKTTKGASRRRIR
jgi:transcriptional regulator with XRE-family HTH domain